MVKKANESVSIGNMDWADWVFEEPYMNMKSINSALKTIKSVRQIVENDALIPQMDNIYFDFLDAIDDVKFQLDGLKKEIQKRNGK